MVYYLVSGTAWILDDMSPSAVLHMYKAVRYSKLGVTDRFSGVLDQTWIESIGILGE